MSACPRASRGVRALIIASILVAAGTIATGASGKSDASCPRTIHRFVDALTEVDGRLDLGIDFNEYRGLISKAHVAYARIPWSQIADPCLSSVGVPSEKAMNEYTVAYNIWAKCIAALNCGRGAAADRQMQFRWRRARQNLQRAVANLTP